LSLRSPPLDHFSKFPFLRFGLWIIKLSHSVFLTFNPLQKKKTCEPLFILLPFYFDDDLGLHGKAIFPISSRSCFFTQMTPVCLRLFPSFLPSMKRPLRWPASRVLSFPRTFPLLSLSFSGPATITPCRAVLPFPGRIQSLSLFAVHGQHPCLHVPPSVLFMRHPSAGLFDSLSPVVKSMDTLPS